MRSLHHLRRGGKVWIRIFPDKPVTKKPAEIRMGSGKGPVDRWVAVVKPGRMMFEVAGVPEVAVREAFRAAHHKLPGRHQGDRSRGGLLSDVARNRRAARRDDDAAPAKELESAHQALFNLRFQAATRQLANVSQIGKAKTRIARIKTLIRERADPGRGRPRCRRGGHGRHEE